MLQRLLSTLWHLLPLPCCLCGLKSDTDYNLCLDCQASLPWQQHVCQQCAVALPETAGISCGPCLQRPPMHTQLLAAFFYQGAIESLIYHFNFGQGLDTGLVLAKCLYQYLLTKPRQRWPDCLIPVPLHVKRLRKRGYNQAAELGKHLACWLSIPIPLHSCQRVHHTPSQTRTAPRDRRRNMHGAFKVSPQFKAKHVAIIDDVYTSGSTTRELCRMLKRAGVETIEIWVVARAGLGSRSGS